MLEPASGSITALHVDDDPEFAEMAAAFLERTAERIVTSREHGQVASRR